MTYHQYSIISIQHYYMMTFTLPQILPEARERFEEYKDLLDDFGGVSYEEFAACVCDGPPRSISL